MLPGTEDRISRALREWHEKNTFKKVVFGHFRHRSHTRFSLLLHQDCTNKDLIAMQYEDAEDDSD